MNKKKHPIVFRFASVFPAALARIEMHAKRSGGPLENIELQFMDRNKVYVGQSFAKEMRAEILKMKKKNRDEEVAACLARKRKKEAKARDEAGLIDPWHGNSQGPIREAIVTAHWEYFEAEDRSDLDDLLTTYGVGETGEEVVHNLSKAKIAAFEKATLAFFDEYFPGSVKHLRMDLDEETPHFHAVIFETAEKTNKTRGTQTLIKPSVNPLLADYELLQDVAGEHFSSIGLVRGEKRAQDVRDAKESELPLPDAVYHVTPREHRNSRAQAIRTKELSLQERERDWAIREANVFLDEVTVDVRLADAKRVEHEACKKEETAREHLACAEKTKAEADAYAEGMTEGLEAIISHQLDYAPDEEGHEGQLCEGCQPLEPEKQDGLWSRIQPAYDRLLSFAKKAFRLRERIYALRRAEGQLARDAKVVADANRRVGQSIDGAFASVVSEFENREYGAADFPGAWAIPEGADGISVDKRLARMTNRSVRNCYLATRDAAALTAEGHTVHWQFARGQQVLEFEAERRGLDLESGRHDPKAASHPERARLHTDEGMRRIKIKRRDGQRQLIRH